MAQELKSQTDSASADQASAQSLVALARYRRDVVLQAVAKSAKELLRSTDLHDSLPKVLERIGHATGVDIMHIFEIERSDPAAEGRVREHYSWLAPGLSVPAMFREAKGNGMADVGLQSWQPRFARGETIVGHVREFEAPIRSLFETAHVKSVVGVPIFVDGSWWGHIGIDDCRSERDWLPSELDAFRTLAELIGATISRIEHLKKLADANRIIENSPTILYRLSPQPPFTLTYLSQNVQRYGYDANALLASKGQWLDLIDKAQHPAILADINALSEGLTEFTLTEFRLRKPDGTYVWFEGHGTAIRDSNRRLTAIEGILTDITDRKSGAEKIAALARTDSLTGLPNRATFLDRARLEFARAKRGGHGFAVLYLDLDHFKDVNDTLGHPVGDALLQAVADRLRSCVRETDMVARFGGDEFAVLQDGISDIGDAESIAVKIGDAIAAPYLLGSNQVHSSASIGVVPYHDDIVDVEDMMMKADLALYRAKEEGRNRFRLHMAELDVRVRERVTVGDDLRLAIERKEFELYYQPQVELASGWIVGLEALIRWNHPTRGLLLPASFIPVAETTGSILPIGQWVIDQACQQIKLWRERGIMPPLVAVNISGAQFKLTSGLDRCVAESLATHNVAANQIEVELTESVLMETTQKHSEAFERLRRIGVRLAIDDFGTGYSSFDYLRSFRVARLKIDHRFIADITSNSDDAAIVRATVTLAQELGIEVIAEGVETDEQRRFLMATGCKLAQGNFFGPAMPVDSVAALLQRDLQLNSM